MSGLQAAAKELNIDLDPALRSRGLDPSLLSSPEGFISRQAFNQCMENLAREYRCPHLALVVAKHGKSIGSSVLLNLARASATLGDALDNCHRHMRLITETRWRIQREAEFVTLIRTVPNGADGHSPQIQTLSVAKQVKLLREIRGSSWSPLSASFTFPAPQDRQHYQRFFGAPVYFGQEYDGMRLAAAELESPIATHDPEMLAVLKQHLVNRGAVIAGSLPDRVSTVIRQHLGRDSCTLAQVASELGLHTKTLQRALRRENCSFKSLLLQVRLEAAQYHLSSSNIELTALADLLGYSCPSALSRAFKLRHGLSPQQWRNHNAAPSLAAV
ncbi:AraC family transcriptional regulator [Parahaliea mediterranea]|uniref:AraC family transcriptional regulator n=1 Tax=Parahaliea mediterranea TaxID=651086 RepID=A0A939IKR4_9GAMM|nr:AraC family transcriptional regulator [Parahaliea mediterranea]MBN7797611.1 AraC family transcriptional regulator [Parahaliea mediterranea]